MINKEKIKAAMTEILMVEMIIGETITVEYAEDKKEGVRKYFPEHIAHMFSTDEIIELIKDTMGDVHKQLSDTGKGEVLMIWIEELKYISYKMLSAELLV